MFLHAYHPGRHTLIWLDPETLAVVAVTTGSTQDQAWDAMKMARQPA